MSTLTPASITRDNGTRDNGTRDNGTREKERRRSQRTPQSMDAFIASPTAKNPNDRLEAQSVNVSKHGVAFRVNKPMAVEAYFIIDFGIGNQRTVTEIRTISCRQTTDGHYEIGAEFA
jgi:hypothetical protein